MIMKKILWICSVLLAMVSCQEDYELNTDFAVPTELSSPASIQLNGDNKYPNLRDVFFLPDSANDVHFPNYHRSTA